MLKLLQHLSTVQGRITTGCAFVLAIVIGLWPDHSRPVDPAKAGAIVTAAIAWLFAEISGQESASLHDGTLFEEIVGALPQDLLDFLRDQDFSVGSYIDPGTKSLYWISHWQGSRYRFVDLALNKRWISAHESIREFAKLLSLNTYPVQGDADLRTVHPTDGDHEDPEPFVERRITSLNAGATKVADQIDEFETFARRRLRL